MSTSQFKTKERGITAGSRKRALRGTEKSVLWYAAFTVFCIVFFLIYDRFSHGVRSFYMTFLWLWPLILGVIPSLIMAWCAPAGADRRPDCYHYGVITLTVASLLQGIFEIAGTGSVHTIVLFAAGGCLLAAGAVTMFFSYK